MGNFNSRPKSMRMCSYGTCRVTWIYRENGMGAKKYCKPHSRYVRLHKQRMYDRKRRLRNG